jgi:hypothetical protein
MEFVCFVFILINVTCLGDGSNNIILSNYLRRHDSDNTQFIHPERSQNCSSVLFYDV